MKNLIRTFSLLIMTCVAISLTAQNGLKKITHSKGYALVDVTSSSIDVIEAEMLAEINSVRTDPAGYKKHVQKYMTDNGIGTNHSYYKDAIDLLSDLDSLSKATVKLKALKANDCLFKTARIHAENQAATGNLNHRNTKDESPSVRIANTCPTEFARWANSIDEKGKPIRIGGGGENLEGSSVFRGAKNSARSANINLLIDGGLGPDHGHRWTMLEKRWTHFSAFTYQDVKNGEIWNRWIQMFGKELSTGTQTASLTSNIPNNAADIKDAASTIVQGGVKSCCNGKKGGSYTSSTGWTYTCEENGVTRSITKECYQGD